jgi:outer membrane murein-binding lipoprotein Lpp
MKRIALALVALAVAVATQSATAGTTRQCANIAAQVKTLAAQVKTLQASVKKLQADVKKQSTDINNVGTFFQILGMCQAAVTADAVQGTWAIVDQILVAGGKPAAFGPQTLVTDFGACAALNNTPHAIGSPPTVTSFSALITLLHG